MSGNGRPKNGREVSEMPFEIAMSPVVVATMVRVGAGLKSSAVEGGSNLGGWPRQRVLDGARKWAEIDGDNSNLMKKNALPRWIAGCEVVTMVLVRRL